MTPYLRWTAAAAAAMSVGATAQRGAIRERLGEPHAARGAAARVTLEYQGRRRAYLLHVPPSADGALVLAFHGGGETPENQEQIRRHPKSEV